MNQLLFPAIVSWRTNNWRRAEQAVRWCKDYGLVPLHKNLYSGKLYLDERNEFDVKMKKLFSGKNDRYCSFVMCASCSPNSVVNFDMPKPPWLDSAFEIVQDGNNP